MISARDLSQNFSPLDDKERSLAWNLEEDWLDHTIQVPLSCGIVRSKKRYFLSNRTYEKDERGAQWIVDRNQVMDLFVKKSKERHVKQFKGTILTVVGFVGACQERVANT